MSTSHLSTMRIASACCSLKDSKRGCNNVHRRSRDSSSCTCAYSNTRSLAVQPCCQLYRTSTVGHILSEKVIQRYVQPEEHICNYGLDRLCEQRQLTIKIVATEHTKFHHQSGYKETTQHTITRHATKVSR